MTYIRALPLARQGRRGRPGRRGCTRRRGRAHRIGAPRAAVKARGGKTLPASARSAGRTPPQQGRGPRTRLALPPWPADYERRTGRAGGGRGGPRPPGLLVCGSTGARTARVRALTCGVHLLDEGKVLRLRRAVVTDEPPLPVVFADRLPQLGVPLEAPRRGLRERLPAVGQRPRRGAGRVEVAVRPHVGEQRRPAL